jgi:hypothetical protein
MAIDGYTWIQNTDEGVPNSGDIIVFNDRIGSVRGHTSVFIEGDTNRFSSFDQNIKGNPPTPWGRSPTRTRRAFRTRPSVNCRPVAWRSREAELAENAGMAAQCAQALFRCGRDRWLEAAARLKAVSRSRSAGCHRGPPTWRSRARSW